MKSWAYAISLLLIDVALPQSSFGQVTYRVDFDATWSASTHPAAFPGSAHFSPLIGATHDSSVTFWEPGGIASPGMEQMAETGGTSLLRNEITAALGPTDFLSGSTIFSPTSISLEFDVQAEASLVTLVTMVAPSPDWFVGVSSFDLHPGGSWIDSAVVDLFTWDAGTDHGADFNSINQDTNPQTPIALLGNPLSSSLPPLGTFTFTLLAVPEPKSLLLLSICCPMVLGRQSRIPTK